MDVRSDSTSSAKLAVRGELGVPLLLAAVPYGASHRFESGLASELGRERMNSSSSSSSSSSKLSCLYSDSVKVPLMESTVSRGSAFSPLASSPPFIKPKPVQHRSGRVNT